MRCEAEGDRLWGEVLTRHLQIVEEKQSNETLSSTFYTVDYHDYVIRVEGNGFS